MYFQIHLKAGEFGETAQEEAINSKQEELEEVNKGEEAKLEKAGAEATILRITGIYNFN